MNDKYGNDLSALLIDDPGVGPIEVYASGPSRGALLRSAGYGPDQGTSSFVVNTGYVVHIEGNQFRLSGLARKGDSGGPVLDQQGRLVGVLWGCDERQVFATSATEADRFLQRAGRYLLPWNARINDPARDPRNQPPTINMPPVVPGGSQVDLSPVYGRLQQVEADIRDLRQTEATAKQVAADWPELKKRVDAAKAEVAANGARLDDALNEESSTGLFGKVRGLIDGAKEKVATTVFGQLLARFGLPLAGALAVVLYLIYRDVQAKIKTGDPLAIEKIAEKVHERLAPKLEGTRVGAAESAVHGQLQALQGIVNALLANKLGMPTQSAPPANPTGPA